MEAPVILLTRYTAMPNQYKCKNKAQKYFFEAARWTCFNPLKRHHSFCCSFLICMTHSLLLPAPPSSHGNYYNITSSVHHYSLLVTSCKHNQYQMPILLYHRENETFEKKLGWSNQRNNITFTVIHSGQSLLLWL